MAYIKKNTQGNIIGYSLLEPPSSEMEDWVWIDTAVASPDSVAANEFINSTPANAQVIPNWLQASYELNSHLAKAMQTANTNAFSLLLSQLSTFHSPEGLAIAVAQVRAGMPEDFTPEEITDINLILERNNIPYQIN